MLVTIATEFRLILGSPPEVNTIEPRKIIAREQRKTSVHRGKPRVLVTTDRPDNSRPNENFTFNQNCPNRLVKS